MRRCARLYGGTPARVTWNTCGGWRREAGIDSTDDAAVRRMDRKRKKKTSNEEWVNPHDRDAEVTKMKNGATHLAYKAEQAVDLDTGAIVAITTQGGAVGDTTSVRGDPAGGRSGGGRADRHADRPGRIQSCTNKACARS